MTSKTFYGWKLCILVFSGNLLLQGSIIYMMNAFTDPLCILHGWTRAQISLSMSLAAFLGALSIPLWSSLSLKFSLRSIMTAGALIGGLSLVALGLVNNIILFAFFYSLAWASGQAFGGAIGNMLLNQWFCIDKGRAFGMANMGTSFSGAIVPFILLIIIVNFDPQTAFIAYGLIIMSLAPVTWFIVYDTPEEIGLHVDNLPDNECPIINSPIPVALSKILKEKDMYLLAFAFSFCLMVSSGVLGQLQPRMVDLGLNSYTAMTFSCITAFFLAISKFFWGKACDKYNPVQVSRVLLFSSLCSLLLVFLPPNIFTLALFSICFGSTVGGSWAVLPATVAFYYGERKFIFYYRVISTFVLLKAIGYIVLGISQSLTGAYDLAYIIFCGILFIALIFTLLLKTNPEEKNEEESVNILPVEA